MMDTRLTVNGRPIDSDVEAELERLGSMPIAALRVRYRELFRSEPPPAFGPDLLRRSISQRIQEKALWWSFPRSKEDAQPIDAVNGFRKRRSP